MTRPKPVILIIDDTRANLKILGSCLRDRYRVIVATDGITGLELAKGENKPDLILLDILMPEMNGYQVCQRLKENPNTSHIPVIFVTGLTDELDEARGLEAGAVDYIHKPFSTAIIRARVKNHLELKLAQEEMEKQNCILKENSSRREDMEGLVQHDLKTPLNTVINMPGLIIEEGGLTPDQEALLRMIQSAGQNMLRQINHSMDQAQMEAGTYHLEPCPIDINTLIIQVCGDLKSHAHRLNLRLVPPMEKKAVFLLGERMLCYTILANLIKNALEASPAHETVQITTHREDGVIIEIHNMGTVPMSIRDRFFEKYATAEKKDGTGLGTYSARLMVETQNGTIGFQTSETKGTTIQIKMPAYPA